MVITNLVAGLSPMNECVVEADSMLGLTECVESNFDLDVPSRTIGDGSSYIRVSAVPVLHEISVFSMSANA